MTIIFYVSAMVAIVATGMVITRRNAVHALLYLVVSLLALGLLFFTLGAPFAAALEVITYAGAIMVLFLFVIMLLNPQVGDDKQPALSGDQGRKPKWPFSFNWRGPGLLTAVLLAELIYVLVGRGQAVGETAVSPQQVGLTLFGPYLLGVELASMLLLAALVGAYHLGRR